MVKIFWFRKDLRIHDNNALHHFVKNMQAEVQFFFIYIKNENTYKYFGEKRINFLIESLKDLDNQLQIFNFNLHIFNGVSIDIINKFINTFKNIEIYANEQYEPYSIERDRQISELLIRNNSSLRLYSDATLFAKEEILKDNSEPYSVFTPFKNKCFNIINGSHYGEVENNIENLKIYNNNEIKTIESSLNISGIKSSLKPMLLKGGRKEGLKLLKNFYENGLDSYKSNRDFPAIQGTSLLSAHLHFGTVNVRECYRAALDKSEKTNNLNEVQTWINELLWREFYYHITFHFPHIINESFKKLSDNIKWNNDKNLFKLWCEGKTGYPIVDAGMRQLNQEGWMHNRLRMITAMFLTKDLFIDWRWGEKYFAEHLIDLDFASNNGGWQWSASTGCDAQPYFRIFNPYLQSKRFDENGEYIRKYIPELKNVPEKYIHKPDEMTNIEQKNYGVILGKDYPLPIVEHHLAKDRIISEFKRVSELNKTN